MSELTKAVQNIAQEANRSKDAAAKNLSSKATSIIKKSTSKYTDNNPITAIDLSNYVVKDDLKNVATKDEIGALRETIADLQKRVKISQILAEKPMSTAKGE